ncbi:NAD/NADP octopine/nopaline dehydrogenase family protein (plasmid) [Paraburkholderia sprentiae WSM5005]|uniref:2-dehydropantoate 2-reductase n=1 Tax=Paraburkholderia sprentiae WSM5005 TaxID=754502 RepID=A0A1I9YWU3_9BURK|nr:NAD/NADP octopine/nopaline dehydrogenase family protein [Paraburkholderia sprentiae]APA90662.2 NAD/NADP octopine/nopaline dehydrogenase family protein [Paraburkholderia sprentiae WSM5005]
MSSKLSVSIIGAGNTGCTFAADLASRGIDVLLYGHPKHRGNIDAIRKKGCLASRMEIEGEFNPTLTTEMADAVQFSHFLVVTVPSYGHADIINDLKGFDLSNHVIVVINGNFFALLSPNELNAQAILETNASPYASWVKDGEVSITGVKSSLPIAALPNNMGEKQWSQISEIFPKTLLWCNNVFEIGMQSNNGVIHPAAGILNTGWIESRKGDFLFYRDGISPSVGNVIEAVDAERLKIAEAFGFRLQTVLQEMVGFYGGACETFSDFASQTKVHNAHKITPTHMQDRYVSEDVPYILVPWYELGSRVEVQAPTIKAVVDIASVINGVDYFKSGRNLKRLGMDHMSKTELLRFIDSATCHLPWAR